MNGERSPSVDGSISGLSVDEAVDRIVGGDEELSTTDDRDTVRQALGHVTDEAGVIREAGAKDGLSELSLLVSTAENRTEVAREQVVAVREAAVSAPDLDVIERRRGALEERYSSIEQRRDAVGERLESIVQAVESRDDLYELGQAMRECTAEARAIQQAADQLFTDAEAVERWLSSPEYRYENLEADLDAIQETLTVVDEDVDTLAGDENGEVEDPALSWLDATYRVRLTELLLVDVRADLDQLRQWDDRDAVRSDTQDTIAPTDIEERIDSLERGRDQLTERLDSVAEPTWSQRFDDAVSSFHDTLDAHEPPVDWAALQATLEEHRGRVRS